MTIRLAHDASWKTLDPMEVDEREISADEKTQFEAFHATRTNLYYCVLPGEVIIALCRWRAASMGNRRGAPE